MGMISAKLLKKFLNQKKLIIFDEVREFKAQSQQVIETVRIPDRGEERYDSVEAFVLKRKLKD